MRGTPAYYFKSLNRPYLICGVSYRLFFLNLGLSLPIYISDPCLVNIGMAIFVSLLLHLISYFVNKADVQMFEVYKRHIFYKKYYQPHPGIHSKPSRIKPSVPFYEGKKGIV